MGYPRHDQRVSLFDERGLRLLPLGQLAGQRIVWNVRPLIATLAEEAQDKHEADMWSFAPALEIASMRHALLDARLFRS
jgi:urease accessory protein